MKFYELPKQERTKLIENINKLIFNDLQNNKSKNIIRYFSDNDTYIRKTAYLTLSRIYFGKRHLRAQILFILDKLLKSENELIRQTSINSAGEIGTFYFEEVQKFFDIGLFDAHYRVRNAVIGSLKKMGNKNPVPALNWAKSYLHHPDKEVRREICHGIELRGRQYPQDILPMLKELEFDQTARVKNTLVHVLGQISYKKGCLKTVITALKTWENKALVQLAIEEIIDVHERYKSFAFLSQTAAIEYIQKNYL